MKALLLASLLLVPPVFVCAGDEGQSEPLLKHIRATLPKGWTAKYEKDTSCLTVERDEPVSGGLGLPNMPALPMEKVSQMYVMGPMKRYSFSFRVMDFVTPAQYQRWVVENAGVEKQARVIYEDFEKRRLLGKGGGWSLARMGIKRLRPGTRNSGHRSTNFLISIFKKSVSGGCGARLRLKKMDGFLSTWMMTAFVANATKSGRRS